VYDAQRLSLHQAGVANSVQLQEEQQATRDRIRTFKENQANFNTAIIHMVQDKTDGGLDDAATAFSAMTAHSAFSIKRQKNRRTRGTKFATTIQFQHYHTPISRW
jgi:hypothetical protein